VFDCIVQMLVSRPEFEAEHFCQGQVMAVVGLRAIEPSGQFPGFLVQTSRVEISHAEEMKGSEHQFSLFRRHQSAMHLVADYRCALKGEQGRSDNFIDATGGTGGGVFRYMFSRFLREAAGITGDARLNESAGEFQCIGDRWQDVAEIFKQGREVADPVAVLAETTAPMTELADLEEAAWTRLRELVWRDARRDEVLACPLP